MILRSVQQRFNLLQKQEQSTKNNKLKTNISSLNLEICLIKSRKTIVENN